MPADLFKNATAFLQKRYPRAAVTNRELTFANKSTGEIAFKVWLMIVQDPDSGVKQRAIAINDIGLGHDCLTIATNVKDNLTQLDKDIFVGFGNAIAPSGHAINTTQMAFAPKLIIYTNVTHAPYQSIMDAFASAGLFVEVINESEMYSTLFISYGGTDENSASIINIYLKSKGVKTWFFPDDALPGQKLHRMMHKGVNNHDRFLLVCSRHSLSRAGVLNEIERVLEREAKEGGSEILIPITLDDYIYEDWAPTRLDLAAQIRSRVITKVALSEPATSEMNAQLDKLVKALSRRHC